MSPGVVTLSKKYDHRHPYASMCRRVSDFRFFVVARDVLALGTSVLVIGIMHAIEHASLPKHVSREYN